MHCDEPLEEFEPGNDRLGVEELFKGIHPALVKLAEWNKQIAVFTTFTIDDQVKQRTVSHFQTKTMLMHRYDFFTYSRYQASYKEKKEKGN